MNTSTCQTVRRHRTKWARIRSVTEIKHLLTILSTFIHGKVISDFKMALEIPKIQTDNPTNHTSPLDSHLGSTDILYLKKNYHVNWHFFKKKIKLI